MKNMDNFTGKKILITGSNGFIGSNLLKSLLPNNKIIGLNNKPDLKIKNYFPIFKDINQISTKDIPGSIDGIIHLAAITDVNLCNKFPMKCFETNVKGTQTILELARKKDCKLIFVSTSHVYGNPPKLPVKEDFPKKPTSVYSTSKLAAEIICEGYSRTYGQNIGIVRLFSVYGKNSPKHLVITRIISQLDKKLILLGNVSTKRDFVYVMDVVDGIKKVFLKSHGLSTYNIGTGKSTSIKEICKLIQKISNKKTPFKSIPKYQRANEIMDIKADISKIKKIGWKPSTKIEEGLRKILN